MPTTFEHERTEAYAVALDLVKDVTAIRSKLPVVRDPIARRLEATATAIVLGVAKGSGEIPGALRARLLRRARRHTIECAAVLDILHTLEPQERPGMVAAKDRLRTIATLLSAMSEWADDFAPATHLQ